MQQELLIELYSEEIPARLQKKALQDAVATFSKIIDSYNVSHGEVKSFISPMRLTLLVEDLEGQTKASVERKTGPSISAGKQAVEGFLRSNNKTANDLIEIDGYYHIDIEMKIFETRTLIGDMIEDFIAKMPWQKSMRWYLEDQKALSAFWVRPIRSILCMYDGTSPGVYLKSVGIRTCSHTYGHRFIAPAAIEVSDFEDYKTRLEDAHVMLDYDKKKNYIDMEMTKNAAGIGLCVGYDEGLLDEVAGLVEYPFIHIGVINEEFMKLPPEVLSTSMKIHQKYFTLTYPDSVIAPFYGVVTNIPGTDVMYDGLNRVLRARLSDAAFFYKEDLDVTLEAFAPRLSNVVFHEKLGSMSQKIDRMMSIADTKEEHRAIALCKADLLTQMVGEFPELQGTIGGIYAKIQDESPELCVAIMEHYKPANATDTIPCTPLGARISFIDKIDSLVGLLGIGIKPTGSKDPFALRRTAIGIVRLLCESNDSILDSETLSWYIDTLVTAYSDQGVPLNPHTVDTVKEFLIDRFKAFMIDGLEVDQDIVNAVVSGFGTPDLDYRTTLDKAQKVKHIVTLDGFGTVKMAYKRSVGVIGDCADDGSDTECWKSAQFKDKHMAGVHDAVLALGKDDSDFSDIVKASSAVLEACENVLINDPDHGVKMANISLFREFVNVVRDRICDLTYIANRAQGE
ncbi:MAG: glycine--tRNA ligase subunit beta [Holosporales bacterium]|jgi:glycyl-tRNA synthetase beta chain|nr:glycine--tRNA ligase subunit beta [Holosporales bacterium]